MKITKLQHTPIDVEYLNKELKKLFSSFYRCTNPIVIKQKSRFMSEFKNKKSSRYFNSRKTYPLSTAKKIEILCTYGGFKLVKSDKRQSGTN